jgi:hypothetical protein
MVMNQTGTAVDRSDALGAYLSRGQRLLLGGGFVAVGLALLVWFPAWTVASRKSCSAGRGVARLALASGIGGALMIGAPAALVMARAWWQVVLCTLLVAVPFGLLWLVVSFFVSFDRCWNF